MGYPVPKTTGYFLEGKKQETTKNADPFSRDQKNPLMNEYLQIIENYENIYKSIPFVEEIYLCNSISFNALHPESDIDLFIITQPQRIRTAKFRAMLLFFFKKAKRTLKIKKRKFCLSFFISADEQNLYKISLKSIDIYLSYRIQHLVLLYKDNPQKKSEIFTKNKRVQGILPNYPQKQCIHLGNKVFYGKNTFKKIIEKCSKGIIGDTVEYLLK
jgi:predicted nucleotidyltransferase